MLDVSSKTIRKWMDDGKVTPVMLPDGRRRMRSSELMEILEGEWGI